MKNGLISCTELFKAWVALDKMQDQNLLIDAMIRATQDARAVDAEPVRHGRWIDTHIVEIKCSECGRAFNLAKVLAHYCPNCGAKMMGGGAE